MSDLFIDFHQIAIATNIFQKKTFKFTIHPFIFLFLRWVSLVRPAPAEIPQDRKVARVGG